MMLLISHHRPAPMPKLLPLGVEPAFTFTVLRPMPAPSVLSSSWTTTTRMTPPKMAAHEMRRWVCAPPPAPSSVVVSSGAAPERAGSR